MPQDKTTGSAGNRYGRECGERIALALGAKKVRADGNSNECLLNGARIVIKCSRAVGLQQVGVYHKMLQRIDAIVGAFENQDRSYDIIRLSAADFVTCMRLRLYDKVELGLVSRTIFAEKGIFLQKLSPLETYADLNMQQAAETCAPTLTEIDSGNRIREILATVKPLAAEYYRLTGKPLGVTGEVAEYVASEILGLTLVPARTVGYDALRGNERIQIKGRAFGKKAKPGQRISRIKMDAPCDAVLLVLLDNATLEAREMWEAPYSAVCECLARPGSKARARGALSVSTFKAIARRIWINEGD